MINKMPTKLTELVRCVISKEHGSYKTKDFKQEILKSIASVPHFRNKDSDAAQNY